MLDLAVEHGKVVVNIPELNQPIQISVLLPAELVVKNIRGIDEVYSETSKLLPIVGNLAMDAFVNKNKSSWDTIQTLLYYWNYRELLRIERIQDDTSLVEYALRKIVLDI